MHIEQVQLVNTASVNRLEYRNEFQMILDIINNGEITGHAIAITGLRRTGKTILLRQIHLNSDRFGVKNDEVLHITLSATVGKTETPRDSLDLQRLNSISTIEYPTLEEVSAFIHREMSNRRIKCILIDEITLCKDLILAGKGLVDHLVNSGMIVIMAGTESLSLKLADEQSLYSRLITVDINYISFAEYCRLKKLRTDTTEDRNKAFDRYMKQGNILDDHVKVDDKYIESAVGINVALSILNSDYEVFMGMEERTKELAQAVIKYIKLIGETITIDTVRQCMTRADISRAIENVNIRRKKVNQDILSLSKGDRNRIAYESAEEIFREYHMSFDVSDISLSYQQLYIIDQSFTKMGLIYDLNVIPCKNNFMDAEDVFAMHSFIYHIVQGIIAYIRSSVELDMSDDDVKALTDNIESAANGRIIENIVDMYYINQLEKRKDMATCIKKYSNGKFAVERKCTKPELYKYNNLIDIDGRHVKAEVDLIINEQEVIRLIEIKKSTAVDEHQTRWLNNDTVIQEIRNKISMRKKIIKEVYYLGEDTVVGDIVYRNIPGVLLKECREQ